MIKVAIINPGYIPSLDPKQETSVSGTLNCFMVPKGVYVFTIMRAPFRRRTSWFTDLSIKTGLLKFDFDVWLE